MSTGKTVGAIWVDVLPSLAGFTGALRAGLATGDAEAAKAGARGGLAYGNAFGDSAATAVEKAAAKVSAAQSKLADAQGKVTVAQAKLNDLVNSGTTSSTKLAAAQAALEKAERNVELQTSRNGLAQQQYNAAQDALVAAQARVATAQQKVNDLAASGNASTKAQTAAAKELAAAQTALETATNRVASTELAVQRTAKSLADAQGTLVVRQQQLNDARSSGTASTAQVAAAEEALAKAQRDVAAQTAAVAAAQEAQKRTSEQVAAAEAGATGETVTFGKALAGVRAEGGLLTNAFGLMNKAMMTAFGVGIVALPIDKLVKSTADYQSALTRLVTTAGESVSNLHAVGQGMLDLAGQTGVSAQDLAAGMYVVESSMSPLETGAKRASDALLILKASAQGARQENANLPDVVNAVSTALHDYKLPATDAATVTSQMITAVSHGKTTFEDLTSALHSVTPLAASLKVPFSDILGSLAAMTSSGESAQQATENMRSALQHLMAPTQPMIQELAQLGITARQFSDDLSTKGLAGTVQEVAKAITDHMGPAGKVVLDTMNKSKLATESLQTMMAAMPPTLAKMSQALLDGTMGYKDYRKAVQELGGSQTAMGQQFLSLVKTQDGYSNALKSGNSSVQNFDQAMQKSMGTTDAMTVALQLMGVHAGDTNAIISDVARSSADASGNIKGWGEVQSNFNQQMAEAKAQIGAMWIELGQHLLPALTAGAGYLNRDVLPAIKSFAGYVADAWHAASQWTAAHKTLVQSLAVGVGAFAGLALAFKTISAVSGAAKTGVELFGKAILGAFAGNTVGLVVGGIAAIAAGLGFAYEHSKTLQNGVHDLVVGFQNGKAALDGSGFDIALQNIGAAASKVWGFLQQLWSGIKGEASSAVSTLASAASQLGSALGGLVSAAEGFGKQIGSSLVAVFQGLWQLVPTVVDAFKNLAVAVGNLLAGGLAEVGTLLGIVVVAAGKVAQGLLDVGKWLLQLATAVLPAVMVPLHLFVTAVDLVAKGLAAIPGPITAVAAGLAILKVAFGLTPYQAFLTIVGNIQMAFRLLAISIGNGAGAIGTALGNIKNAITEAKLAGQFEAMVQGAGTVEQKISGMASVATTGFRTVATEAGNLATKGFGALKSAASGLMDMFGGPWGIAIIGVTAGIWAITNAIAAHEQQVKQDTQTMTGWYKAMANSSQDAQAAQSAYTNILAKQKELADAQARVNQLTAEQGPAMQEAGRGAGLMGTAINMAKGHVADLQKEFKDSYNALDPLEKKQVDLYLAIERYGASSPEAASKAKALNDQEDKLAKLANDAKYAIEGENGAIRQKMDTELASIDTSLAAQQSVLDAKSAIQQYQTALKDSNTSDLEKAQAQNSMAQAIEQAVAQTEQAVIKNEQSIDPQKRSADATAAARDVFNQLTGAIGQVPPQLQGLADQLNGATTTALDNAKGTLGSTQDAINTTQVDLGKLGDQFGHLANNDVAQVAIPGLQNLQKEMNGPTVSALTGGQSAVGNLGQAFVNTNGQVTTVFIPGLLQMQGQLNGPTVQALLNTLANTDNAKDAIGYLTQAVKSMPPGTTIDIGADTSAATNSIDTLITSYGKVTYTGSSIIVNGKVIANADGNLLTSGMSPMSASMAQVVAPGTLRVIGDNPVADEAFIPLNGSARSEMILGEAAGRMGFGLVPMQMGGIITHRPLAEPVHWPAWQAPHETFPIQWDPNYLKAIAQDMVALQNAAKAAAAAGFVGGPPASRAANVQTVNQVANTYGWGSGVQWQDLVAVIMRESGFNNVAQNPTSTAYGMFQFLDSTWAGYPYGKTSDPYQQAVDGLLYIARRYGTPAGALAHENAYGWYADGGIRATSGRNFVFDGSYVHDDGGLWPSGTPSFNFTGGIERVLTPPQDDYFRRFVDTTEHHQHVTHQGALIGGDVNLTMAQANPNEALDALFHRLRVAQRGGVFAMNPAYTG